jgi:putative hydrolases of HD superfamily
MDKINERFKRQLNFLIEIDKLKHIFRKTKLFNKSRFENDAEHSWHLALMVLVFSEYSNDKHIDINKVIKMVLIHDLVEIDAGDVLVYDTVNRANAFEKEKIAAERIFGLLPDDQKDEFISLWEEFEKRESSEAKFAAAIDRFEPILQNQLTDYHTWHTNNIKFSQLYEKNNHIQDGSHTIWAVAKSIFHEAKEKELIND